MAFIKVTNDDRYTLIDDTFQNYIHAYTAVYDFVLPHPVYPDIWYKNETPFYYEGHSDSAPIVAILCAGGGTLPIPFSMSRSGNTFGFKFQGTRGNKDARRGTIVIFDRPQATDRGTGLVKVYNAQGKLTFDSDRRYLKVVRELKSGETYLPSGTTGIIYASNTMGYSFVSANGMVGWQFATTFVLSRSDNLLYTEARTFDTYLGRSYTPPPAGWPSNIVVGTLRALVVDLTGFV